MRAKGKLEFGWSRIVLSLLIVGLGWLGGQELSAIDQDLRVMYTEYTLGATDLAHLMADTIRYRNTIVRALEAKDQKEFERITGSLPELRAKIQHGIDRYAAASLRVSRSGRSEPEDLQAVRLSLDDYFHTANRTIDLLVQEWAAPNPAQATALRRKAEHHAAENAGPKMIQLSIALDRLLETIADVAKDMRDEGTRTIRLTSMLLFFGSLFLAALNLLMGFRRTRPAAAPSSADWPTSVRTAEPPHA
ncbi:hypothetical protein YTPLAS18_32980 [Nitrospira sp.]|nr:hypothetical protein YTPLAS18_32980 [Nitrospira sp.]